MSSPISPRTLRWTALVAAILLAACGRSEGGGTPGPRSGLPAADRIAQVPMGHIAGHTDSAALARSFPNPYAGDPQAVSQGKKLYLEMNCVGCHAPAGTGNMGPSLADTAWRYGGYPVQIFKSIQDGRGKGMPAWGSALPPQEIWKLVAYIESLGGALAANGLPEDQQRGDVIAPEAAQQIGNRPGLVPQATISAAPAERSSSMPTAPVQATAPTEPPPKTAPASAAGPA